MKKEIYTPMEKVLVEGAQKLTTKEICEQALEAKQKTKEALELDLMLLELERKLDELNERAIEWWL